jgi:hypothetical protein
MRGQLQTLKVPRPMPRTPLRLRPSNDDDDDEGDDLHLLRRHLRSRQFERYR